MRIAILNLAFSLTTAFAAAAPNVPKENTRWYVSPSGNDDAAGSIEHPFATVQRAQKSANAGDTVFLRGGIYRMQESQIARRKGQFAAITDLNKSGAPGKPITYRAYRDEKPTFDCSEVKPQNMRVSAFLVRGSWLRLEGIDVTGVQVTIQSHTQSICFESDGSNNVFDRLSMHDGQAIGIYHVRGANNLFLNCDAWNNWDYTSENKLGGNVDGFGCHSTKGSIGNVFRGCRAWFNSDDGYDCLGAQEAVVFENCWAFYNGYSPKFERLHDGNGFKAGGYGSAPPARLPKVIPRHIVRFCVAVGNKNSGFYANHHPGGCDWINNTAFKNAPNFNMLGRLLDNRTDVDGTGHRLINNVAHGSRTAIAKANLPQCELVTNSFSNDRQLSSKDFVSLETSDLTRPRQKDGDLPVINLLHPSPSGALIDAGTDVGQPFRGAKPDLGAFEGIRPEKPVGR